MNYEEFVKKSIEMAEKRHASTLKEYADEDAEVRIEVLEETVAKDLLKGVLASLGSVIRDNNDSLFQTAFHGTIQREKAGVGRIVQSFTGLGIRTDSVHARLCGAREMKSYECMVGWVAMNDPMRCDTIFLAISFDDGWWCYAWEDDEAMFADVEWEGWWILLRMAGNVRVHSAPWVIDVRNEGLKPLQLRPC